MDNEMRALANNLLAAAEHEAAQAAALVYVGDQLARIADMLAGGFKAERDDYGRLGVYPEQRR